GPPRSMSRSIDAVIGEPRSVSIARARSRKGTRGVFPAAVATATHSASNSRISASPSAVATMAPTGARMRQVMPASVASKTIFSHISCRIPSLCTQSKRAPSRRAAKAVVRALGRPSRSPKTRRGPLFPCAVAPAVPKPRRDRAGTAEHAPGAEARIETVEMIETIEERQDGAFGANGGRDAVDGAVEIVGLAAQQHEIEGGRTGGRSQGQHPEV